MKREIFDVVQGTEKWLELRKDYDTASEAPAIFNQSKHLKRNELLDAKKFGVRKEINAWTQKIFDEGHAAESSARILIDDYFGLELFPAVMSYGDKLASCDGLTIDGAIGFEHKL